MTEERKYAALYELRLFLTLHSHLVHINEYLYTETESDNRLSGEKQFDYVNPRNREVQIEMEEAFTRYLKSINALLEPVLYERTNHAVGADSGRGCCAFSESGDQKQDDDS